MEREPLAALKSLPQLINVASLSLQKRNWEWTDRSSKSSLMWKQGEPNNRGNNENCVELWSPSGKPRWSMEASGLICLPKLTPRMPFKE